MSRASAGTALRAMELPDDNGVRVLNIREIDYRDGAEEALLTLLAGAQDVSSTSDELAGMATSWAEQYHLDPSRANVLRVLSIPAGARILEVGAGCGTLTRYLGEQGVEVDAVEPVLSRARVARERCRDLGSVEVFVGQIEDVPRAADYDLVIVVGVLEYTGRGYSGTEQHQRFLEEVRARLAPGGSLILAIENKLGTKYLAGAPEDHYNVPFEGVEGYPSGGTRARTFSRRELEGMLTEVGLSPRTLAAFPDYKMTRAVLDPLALAGTPEQSLLSNLPIFPSPDWVGVRSPAANEQLLWRSLVEAGLALDTSNSLLILASNGEPAGELWPGERLARYFSWNRRREFTLVSTVERDLTGAVHIHREPLVSEKSAGGLSIVGSVDPFVEGGDFIDGFVSADENGSRALVGQWVELVAEREKRGDLSFDCVPANIRIVSDGSLAVIDDEWRMDDVKADWVIRRGILLLALKFRGTGRRPSWVSKDSTPREIALLIGSWAGMEDRSWLDRTVDEESVLQAGIQRPTGRVSGDRIEDNRIRLNLALVESNSPEVSLRWKERGGRDSNFSRAELQNVTDSVQELSRYVMRFEQAYRQQVTTLEARLTGDATAYRSKLDEMQKVNSKLESRLESASAELRKLESRHEAASAELIRMRNTLSWRLTKWLRRLRGLSRKNGG